MKWVWENRTWIFSGIGIISLSIGYFFTQNGVEKMNHIQKIKSGIFINEKWNGQIFAQIHDFLPSISPELQE